jgi:hypothetical protein
MERSNDGETPSFNPATLQAVARAIDDAWDKVQRSGSPFAGDFYARTVRAFLVRRINQMAHSGETDMRRLSEDAILFFAQTYKE